MFDLIPFLPWYLNLLALLLGYGGVGYAYALSQTARYYTNNRAKHKPGPNSQYCGQSPHRGSFGNLDRRPCEDHVQDDVLFAVLGATALWPVMIPARLIDKASGTKLLDYTRRDPERLPRVLRELETKNEQLERTAYK